MDEVLVLPRSLLIRTSDQGDFLCREKMSRYRNATVTVNDIDDSKPADNYFGLPRDEVKYCVYQWEKGARIHLQCYFEFTSCKSMEQIKSICGRTAHIEKRIGTAAQASDYCKKDDSRHEGRGPYEWGEISRQGKRNDLDDIITRFRGGDRIHDIVDAYPAQFVRYGRGLREVQQMLRPPPKAYTKKTVNVLWGPPGVGKSYFIHMLMDLLQQPVFIKSPSTKWWDNYQDQKYILMDEYPGTMTAKEAKVILGEINGPLETKGGSFTTDKIETFWITSNDDPGTWFQAASDVDRRAVSRRLTRTVHVEQWDDLREIFFLYALPPFAFQNAPNVL